MIFLLTLLLLKYQYCSFISAGISLTIPSLQKTKNKTPELYLLTLFPRKLYPLEEDVSR